jgi:signal transduction histidine kinase
MALLRLRTQLLIATLLIISTLTGALLLIVRYAVRSELDEEVKASTDASIRAFQSVQRQREFQLSRTAAMLAELPTLKALMTTEDPPTIQDASDTFWRLAGSDLFLLARPNGSVLGFHVKKQGWSQRVAEADLKRSAEQGEDAAWWYADSQLYWVFLRPINVGPENDRKQLGLLAVGYQVDSSVAEQLAVVSGSQIVLAIGEIVIASTLPSSEESDLRRWIGRKGLTSPTGTRELTLGTDQYQVESVLIHEDPPTRLQCYVLLSFQRSNRFLQRLNRTIFILGASAVVLGALLLSFVSRTITHPLDNLVSGVRALAAGDYMFSITPRGSSEVAELGEAFSKMRDELLASQQRWIAAERIAALGSAASSISHDLRHHLAAVVANAEFLYEAENLKLNRDEIYAEIKTASSEMTDLLDSLRELAREDGAVSPAAACLDQTIRHAVEAVLRKPELRSRRISITASGETEGVFDSKKMERAFFNLVLNACEATAQLQGQINIDMHSSAESFDVRVADNGPGIPASIRSTLFDPFVSSGKPNGTGLGLAIVNKVIRDHGGSVTVEQTSEAGTVFLVKLPRSARAVSASSQAAVI